MNSFNAIIPLNLQETFKYRGEKKGRRNVTKSNPRTGNDFPVPPVFVFQLGEFSRQDDGGNRKKKKDNTIKRYMVVEGGLGGAGCGNRRNVAVLGRNDTARG